MSGPLNPENIPLADCGTAAGRAAGKKSFCANEHSRGQILFGTCGYDYPEWRGVFYPAGLARAEFLSFYAEQFSALEVNFTYYRMPTEYQFRSMLLRSGNKLMYSVKAPQTLTRLISRDWDQDVLRFRAALLPLVNANQLSAVLFQFPQSFRYTKENRIYLDELLKSFSSFPSVVEFRHNEWLTERVYEGLSAHGAGICVCDMPRLRSLPAYKPVVTGNIGYMRFHGRNAQNWYGGDGTEPCARYEYLYRDSELRDALPGLADMAAKSNVTQVFFNNHPKGAAAVNAKMMEEMMSPPNE